MKCTSGLELGLEQDRPTVKGGAEADKLEVDDGGPPLPKDPKLIISRAWKSINSIGAKAKKFVNKPIIKYQESKSPR